MIAVSLLRHILRSVLTHSHSMAKSSAMDIIGFPVCCRTKQETPQTQYGQCIGLRQCNFLFYTLHLSTGCIFCQQNHNDPTILHPSAVIMMNGQLLNTIDLDVRIIGAVPSASQRGLNSFPHLTAQLGIHWRLGEGFFPTRVIVFGIFHIIGIVLDDSIGQILQKDIFGGLCFPAVAGRIKGIDKLSTICQYLATGTIHCLNGTFLTWIITHIDLITLGIHDIIQGTGPHALHCIGAGSHRLGFQCLNGPTVWHFRRHNTI